MSGADMLLCRLCAIGKTADGLHDLLQDSERYQQFSIMLLSFKALVEVDISNSNLLPKTVCYVCYQSLENTLYFINSVREAQNILISKICQKLEDVEDLKPDEDTEQEINTPTLLGIESMAPDKESLDEKWVCNSESEYDVRRNDDINNDFPALESNKFNLYELTSDIDYCNDVIEFPRKTTRFQKSKRRKTCKHTWNDYAWICSFCGIQFPSAEALRSHAKDKHSKCYAFMCVDCTTMHKTFNSYVSHVQRHRTHLKRYCHYCNLKLTRKVNAKTHISTHLTDDHICEQCGEVLPTVEALTEHRNKYQSSTVKHLVRKPRRKKGEQVTEADRTCRTCQRLFSSKAGLSRHMLIHSGRQRDFTCDKCGKTFYQRGALDYHITIHSTQRTQQCKICNRTFPTASSLRHHVATHNSARPFTCEHCGKSYKTRLQIKLHLAIHSPALPFTCEYCSKGFRYSQHLKCHIRQHTGAKPYSCDECFIKFTNWPNWNKHMKRRHGRDMSKKKHTALGILPVDPQTGRVIDIPDPSSTEEWRKQIMLPSKRGKKPKLNNILES